MNTHLFQKTMLLSSSATVDYRMLLTDMNGLCCELELQAASVDAVVTLLKNDFLTLETLVSIFFFFC